jgi:trigger factor
VYKWEKIDTNKVCLEVEVPVEEVDDALDKAYSKVVKKITVPGFRKGKAPRKILESRYGPEIFYEDALEILVDPNYNKAVKECQLEPIDKPELELVQMEKGKPLIFKVTVDVKPEVELGNYKGITIEQEKKEITAEDVEKYLSSLREQHARLVTLEEGEIREKDLAVIDFSGTIDGEPFEGGEAENYSLEIGSGSFIRGFEEQLIGAHKNEEREVKVTFPEDYNQEELRGKEAVFHVKVKEIKRPQLPELNDEFVQELTEEFSTLEEFKADVENKLKENLENKEKINLESMLIEKIAEESKVDVPEVLVERELDNRLAEFEYYLRMQGLTLEQYGQLVEGGIEKIREEQRGEALKHAKANLVLDAIIKKEALEATDEEVEEKIKEVVQNTNVKNGDEIDLEKIKEQFEKQGRLDIIAHEIKYRKAIDLLVEHANIIQIEPGSTGEVNNKDEGKEKGVKTESKDEGEKKDPGVEDTPNTRKEDE